MEIKLIKAQDGRVSEKSNYDNLYNIQIRNTENKFMSKIA